MGYGADEIIESVEALGKGVGQFWQVVPWSVGIKEN